MVPHSGLLKKQTETDLLLMCATWCQKNVLIIPCTRNRSDTCFDIVWFILWSIIVSYFHAFRQPWWNGGEIFILLLWIILFMEWKKEDCLWIKVDQWKLLNEKQISPFGYNCNTWVICNSSFPSNPFGTLQFLNFVNSNEWDCHLFELKFDF